MVYVYRYRLMIKRICTQEKRRLTSCPRSVEVYPIEAFLAKSMVMYKFKQMPLARMGKVSLQVLRTLKRLTQKMLY